MRPPLLGVQAGATARRRGGVSVSEIGVLSQSRFHYAHGMQLGHMRWGKMKPMRQWYLRSSSILIVAAVPLVIASCATPDMPDDTPQPPVERLVAEVQERFDFDPSSFAQGLELAPDNTLYVGTGRVGESRIYRRTLDGNEVASRTLDPAFFGEGITRVDASVWQLTWQHGVAMKRDAESLEETGRAFYAGEGWGLCYRPAANEVILSDGSAQLRRMDPFTFEERERFTVTLDNEPVTQLNELECVGDDVYANIFTTTDIVRIDASSGMVTAVIDAASVPNNADPDPDNVLNGIAHIPGTDEFYLSGKRWPDLYRVRFVPAG